MDREFVSRLILEGFGKSARVLARDRGLRIESSF